MIWKSHPCEKVWTNNQFTKIPKDHSFSETWIHTVLLQSLWLHLRRPHKNKMDPYQRIGILQIDACSLIQLYNHLLCLDGMLGTLHDEIVLQHLSSPFAVQNLSSATQLQGTELLNDDQRDISLSQIQLNSKAPCHHPILVLSDAEVQYFKNLEAHPPYLYFWWYPDFPRPLQNGESEDYENEALFHRNQRLPKNQPFVP